MVPEKDPDTGNPAARTVNEKVRLLPTNEPAIEVISPSVVDDEVKVKATLSPLAVVVTPDAAPVILIEGIAIFQLVLSPLAAMVALPE